MVLVVITSIFFRPVHPELLPLPICCMCKSSQVLSCQLSSLLVAFLPLANNIIDHLYFLLPLKMLSIKKAMARLRKKREKKEENQTMWKGKKRNKIKLCNQFQFLSLLNYCHSQSVILYIKFLSSFLWNVTCAKCFRLLRVSIMMHWNGKVVNL